MVTVNDDGSLDGGGRPHLPVPEGLTIPPDRSDAPVAVIHSLTTASAHEFATLAFTGRDATRTFGAPTSGLPTAVEGFPLPNGSLLMLTTGLGVDRTGATHDSALLPDEAVTGTRVQPPPPGGTDPALDAARRWLAADPACAS
jgi:C-terminal processing protease CtpA/Prc